MKYKRLFILVEGLDDERFFNNRIIKSKIEGKYTTVEIYKYAYIKDEKVGNFLKSIKAMNSEYIYLTDINNAPCISFKKDEIQRRLKGNVDKDRIILVIQEIEGWYLAGLNEESSNELKIKHFRDTNNLTKEQFNNLMPSKFRSRVNFIIEILDSFQIEIAKKKNSSFRYFSEKYDC